MPHLTKALLNAKKSIISWLRKDKKIILASVFTGFAAVMVFGAASAVYAENVQAGIAGEIMRLHVLANSDSQEDQELKLIVRDGILAEFSPVLAGAESLDETRGLLSNYLPEIEALAQNIIWEQGYNYTVAANLTSDFFPTRTYQDISLPAGTYETLRIEIGEASGQNWWCVMFPPLCFVDIVSGYEYSDGGDAARLKNLLPAEGYELVTNTENAKVRFMIVELWQSFKNRVFGRNR